MLAYKGEMSDAHLQAAIRAALAAHGLYLDPSEYAAVIAAHWENGSLLRDEILEGILDEADLRCLQDQEPYLWQRIPLIADLGFRQAVAFESFLGQEESRARQAAVLAGAFNLAITLIDYLVDETNTGISVFSTLDEAMVRKMFTRPDVAREELVQAGRRQVRIRERLLFGLIADCCSRGSELLAQTRNSAAWSELGKVIALCLRGEAEVSTCRWPNHSEARTLLTAMEAKSSLPTLATLHIVCLAHAPWCALPMKEAMEAATWIGNLLWRIDDLVDLLKDHRSGTPNAALVRLADRLECELRSFATDTDIYDEIHTWAEDLLHGVASPAWTIDTGEDSSSSDLLRFARYAAAGWAGWQDEPGYRQRRSMYDDGEATSRALGYLLSQHESAYEEAVHHLHFPRLLDSGVCYETQPASLSFRAVLLDALLDAAEAGMRVPARVLASDVMDILRCKHRYARGGWSYIQQAPELPPDADDLGQVLQVLARYGGPTLASICDEAIRLVLDKAEDDGSFCTWILDPRGDTFAEQRVREYLAVMGGWGVHPEVVCNLLYGLLLYAPERYREALNHALGYIGKSQNTQGAWDSKWYLGAFYGTWRAVSVLERLAPAHPGLGAAKRFLYAAQRSDGGWGEEQSDALNTAFALLSLVEAGEEFSCAVSAGVEYLLRTQRADGSWPDCTWISFPTVDGVVTYGSASMSTAFCLKALLVHRPVGDASRRDIGQATAQA